MIKKITSVLFTPLFAFFCMGGLALPFSLQQTKGDAGEDRDFAMVVEADRTIADRPMAIDSTLAKMHTVTFLDNEGNIDFTVEVEHGKTLGYIPESEWEEGILDYWSNKYTSERLRENTLILENAIYEPNYIYIEGLILNALALSGLTLEDVDLDNFSDTISYIKEVYNS